MQYQTLGVCRRMHLWKTSLLPDHTPCRGYQAYTAPALLCTAAHAHSRSNGVAAPQRKVPSQRKPTSLAAPGTPLRQNQQRRTENSPVTTRPDTRAWLETLVVVEGVSDQCAVRKAVPAQVCQISIQPEFATTSNCNSCNKSWSTEPHTVC